MANKSMVMYKISCSNIEKARLSVSVRANPEKLKMINNLE
jgi:hypothetical protein